MIDFKDEYQNALICKRTNINPINTQEYFFFPNISQFSRQHLFYINYAGFTTAYYPNFIKINTIKSYLLIYTINGQGKINYNNENYYLKANTIFFIDCKKSFQAETFNSSNWSYIWIYFNGNISTQLYNRYISDNYPLLNCSPLSDINTYIKKITDSLHVTPHNELTISMLLYNLLTAILLEKEYYKKQLSFIPIYIIKIKNEFDNYYSNTYDLQTLAKKFKISKYTLCREFKKYIYLSPIEYLIRKRISVSKDLLSTTNNSVNEIARTIGIDNTTHFINLFKKRVGVTPLQYRNRKGISL